MGLIFSKFFIVLNISTTAYMQFCTVQYRNLDFEIKHFRQIKCGVEIVLL